MTLLCACAVASAPPADGGPLRRYCTPMRGEHASTCGDDQCKGCLPRPAEPGLQVCTACRLRTADNLLELGIGTTHQVDPGVESRTLPSLYDALLQPARAAGNATPAAEEDRAMTLGDGARNARESIERMLSTWCAEIGPEPHPTPVPAQTARVLRHLRWLLADPRLADQLVHDVDVAWAEARRRAYPSKPDGHVIGPCPIRTPDGPCGGPVRAVVDAVDKQGWAKCPTCKTSAVLDWWLALMPPEQHEYLGMRALRWHLALHCHRQIGETTIRTWASKPEAEPALPSRVDEETGRVQYRVEEARALCELRRRRGRPPLASSA